MYAFPRLSRPAPLSSLALTQLAANDARVSITDYAGTLTRTSTESYIVRPIVQAQGYHYAAPGARLRVAVSGAGTLLFYLRYMPLITRAEVWAPIGSVLKDGVEVAQYTSPAAYNVQADSTVSVILDGSTSLVEIVLPNNAAVYYRGIGHTSGISVSAPAARPTQKLVVGGDSRAHGIPVARPTDTFAYQLADMLGLQLCNTANGSAGVDGSIGAVMAAESPYAALYLCDINNFIPGGADLTAFQASYAADLTGFRAGSAAKFFGMTSLASSSDAGGTGPYTGNSPTLAQFRTKDAAALTAAGAGFYTISGTAVGMPTSYLDGIHPTTRAEGTAIANVAYAIMDPLL